MSLEMELASSGGGSDLRRERRLLSSAAIAHGFAAALAATVLAVAADAPVWRFVIWARMTVFIQPPDVVAITMTGIAFQITFAVVAAIAARKLRPGGAASPSSVGCLASVAGAVALFYSYAGFGGLVGIAGAGLSLVGAGRAWARLAPEVFRRPSGFGSRLERPWLVWSAILFGGVGVLLLGTWLAVFGGLGHDGLFYVESAVMYSVGPILILIGRPRSARAAVT
jgi:hypothetical protein